MLEQFQPHGFDVFCGSEAFLLATRRAGGVGCITATASVNPGPIARLASTWQQPDADAQQAALNSVRGMLQQYTMIPALKAVIAGYLGDPAWPPRGRHWSSSTKRNAARCWRRCARPASQCPASPTTFGLAGGRRASALQANLIHHAQAESI